LTCSYYRPCPDPPGRGFLFSPWELCGIFYGIIYGIILWTHPTTDHSFKTPKTELMIHRPFFQRVLVISFMILVGFCLAKAIYSQSITGIVLAIISLVAGIYFLYLLNLANEETEKVQKVQKV
jgi:hypothetical protein